MRGVENEGERNGFDMMKMKRKSLCGGGKLYVPSRSLSPSLTQARVCPCVPWMEGASWPRALFPATFFLCVCEFVTLRAAVAVCDKCM